MEIFTTTQFVNGTPYKAQMIEDMGECTEIVKRYGHTVIHEATFPSSNLGQANRNEYVRVMLASIGEADQRRHT